MDYFELTVNISPREPWADILIAELAEFGFESFVETETGIQAYAPVQIGDVSSILKETCIHENNEIDVKWHLSEIPHQNWNAAWEASFEPVLIDSRLAIIAPFHQVSDFPGRELIVIQPQMSFGTGHHQTTYLMSQFLLDLPELPGKVLDMGTGTGVLAILAEKKGARDILAVDIEPWSVENTLENASRNSCTRIRGLLGDIDSVGEGNFGVILANINKNVLKRHLPYYAELCSDKGLLYLSGFFISDVPELEKAARDVGFELVETRDKETWASMKLQKVVI
ncbi:50S ribosomal protein L11 methyltransferase [Fluviicola sp.]|jgi:ribosomal protein L11 methyltransferase|uniref:50S ribosomal protein L11 methyltransferase n=1 Tax=Fluviicola sp. TaxID=1917219 RepID=UPI002829B29D|nr:50S ribosomal protein L11 methyltransferase [Fluviicola sp.]MDR0803244.1 50S ribosomal protein L11 methyltransferase [Fluviicola sp.]